MGEKSETAINGNVPPLAAWLSRTADAATLAKIEALRLRDGISRTRFLALATEAYALMLPGWPYPPEDHGK